MGLKRGKCRRIGTGPAVCPVRWRRSAALWAGLVAVIWAVRPAGGGDMKIYPTRYYVIHTDLDRDGVREAALRMTIMAEEYHERTKGFSGAIRRKLPFHLFRKKEDYYAAGGKAGSAGVFNGHKLMAIAGDRTSERTWHVVQHEAFHQFVHAVIRGDVPVWANEGLAEYFGQAIFTGDGFVCGVVPPRRLKRLKGEIQGSKLKTLREMMTMTYKQWGSQLYMGNYDQAWSMIHFLVHAEDGKYVKGLNGFMNDIGRRRRHEHAWVRNFGRDVEGFEKRWRDHWLARPPNPTADLYTKAVVATMTGYFARAQSQKQTFADAEAFLKAAGADELKAHDKDWLPPALLKSNLPRAAKLGKWAIETPERTLPRLTCTSADGKRFVGVFWTDAGRVSKVRVRIEAPPSPETAPAPEQPANQTVAAPETKPAPRPSGDDPVGGAIGLAKAYQAMGRKEKARQVVTEALKANPDSPRAAEAKALLEALK